MKKITIIFLTLIALVSISKAQVIILIDDDLFVLPIAHQNQNEPGVAYFNNFSTVADGDRIDQFVAYRDPWVVNNTVGRSDHVSTGGINCTAPEQTRPQTRENPVAHVYQCLPGGNSDAGHQMAFAMDTSGYGFVGALPDQVFEDVTEVSVDINTTNAGGRNFIEIKIIPANNVYVNGMPCIPDLPCNGGWDYNDIGAVGARATGMTIATPSVPDGYRYSRYDYNVLSNGDKQYSFCDTEPNPETGNIPYCFQLTTHQENKSIRDRYQHIFRDNGDGTLSFGIESAGGYYEWIEAPGAFPSGSVRVVIAFHNYTGTKSGNGPGFEDNLSPSEGGFTWHWDDLSVMAVKSTPSVDFFGGTNPERIVTPNNCIAFSQGQREVSSNTNVEPRFHCIGDPDLDL